MPLFSTPFALDTENDMVEGYDEPIPVTIQMCPIDARSDKDVVVLEGVDCYVQFLRKFEETQGKQVICSVFNADHEWAGLERHVVGRYEWFERTEDNKHIPNGCFTVNGDDRLTYKIEIRNQHGCILRITDDWERSKKAMKDVASDVFTEHPEWWPEGTTKDDLKLEIDENWYNSGWFRSEDPLHELMMAYAKRDSFTQAQIMKYNIYNDRALYLTSSSAGMGECLLQTYHPPYFRKDGTEYSHWSRLQMAQKNFRKDYPPLNRKMQDIVEDSLVGGFVYGSPGVHKGPLVHIDFKSSYPQHYCNEDSFIGSVSILKPTHPLYEVQRKNPKYFRWFLVSFDFDGLKEGGMPVFSGKECWWPDGRPPGCYNHKMKSGSIRMKLFTEDYLEEIQHHMNISNLTIHEMWFAKRFKGKFAKFIGQEYVLKEWCKAKGEKAEAARHKDNMNGGVHGKTITKTHRKQVTYENGKKEFKNVINEPEYCALIGFTGMMQRRCALLKACRQIQEAGHPVLMCDTDSIVTQATEEDVRKVFGDLIAEELDVKGMVERYKGYPYDREPEDEIDLVPPECREKILSTLGKFELEKDDEGNVEFDEFRCWGLKRYLELNHGEYRKSAFASMHKDVQRKVLMDFPIDGTVKSWTQKGKKRGKYTNLILNVTKSAKLEDIWYVPIEERPKKKGKGISGLKEENTGYESSLLMDFEEEEE